MQRRRKPQAHPLSGRAQSTVGADLWLPLRRYSVSFGRKSLQKAIQHTGSGPVSAMVCTAGTYALLRCHRGCYDKGTRAAKDLRVLQYHHICHGCGTSLCATAKIRNGRIFCQFFHYTSDQFSAKHSVVAKAGRIGGFCQIHSSVSGGCFGKCDGYWNGQ